MRFCLLTTNPPPPPFLFLVLQFYVDTVKKMAQRQFVSGSPLRTLCLLIAGQPADVFSAENPVDSFSGAANGAHGPTQVINLCVNSKLLKLPTGGGSV